MFRVNVERENNALSTISAHGRALKHHRLDCDAAFRELSTISAHGRALKHGLDVDDG